MESIMGLMKVGKREHLEAFRNGQVYCNTLQYFKELEYSFPGMGDRFECAESVEQFDELSIWINDRYVPVLKNGFGAWDQGRYRGNVFCTYLINIPIEEVSKVDAYPLNIKSSVSDFADCFVIIGNINGFTQRFKNAVVKNGDQLLYGPIDYIDFKNYTGDVTPFNKNVKFQDQKEFRYYIDRVAKSESDTCLYDLGDLSNIVSEVIEVKAISTLTFFRNNIPIETPE